MGAWVVTGLSKSNLDATANLRTVSRCDSLDSTRVVEHLAEHGIRGWLGQQVLLASDFARRVQHVAQPEACKRFLPRLTSKKLLATREAAEAPHHAYARLVEAILPMTVEPQTACA